MSIVKNPSIWGPPIWDVLHYLTFQYSPLSQSKNMRLLFTKHLPNLMPCRKCRDNYKEHIKKIPLRLESAESLSKWLVKIHNLVNVTKTNPTRKYTYAEVKKKYHLVLAKDRVLDSFLKWSCIMRPNILQASIDLQRSYSFFMSFVFQSSFSYNE
tara:strand:+ start:4053 stop:4517 length:465 start_codon:yes stop_codon:yes gene_type:complete